MPLDAEDTEIIRKLLWRNKAGTLTSEETVLLRKVLELGEKMNLLQAETMVCKKQLKELLHQVSIRDEECPI